MLSYGLEKEGLQGLLSNPKSMYRKYCITCTRQLTRMVLVNGKYHQICDCSKDNTKYTLAKALATRRTNRISRERALRRASVVGTIQTMTLIAGLMCVPMFLFPQSLTYTAVASEAPVVQEISVSGSPEMAPRTQGTTVKETVAIYAQKHEIDPEKYYALISCENHDLDPNLQSNLKYKFSDPKRGIVKGAREESYGLLQIHKPDFPEITFEQMTSVDWSLDWGAKEIKEGRAWRWKTCGKRAGLL